jgi:hypothetical protein
MPESNKPGWEKISIILAGIAAAIAIMGYFSSKLVFKDWFPTEKLSPTPPAKPGDTPTIVRPYSPPPPSPQVIKLPPAKSAFLGIQRSDNSLLFESTLSEGMSNVFKNNGHDPIATSPGQKIYDFANLVCYTLSLGKPEEKKDPFNTVTYDYKVQLTLRFFHGPESTPCATLVYVYPVPRPDNHADTNEILKQGVADLVNQLSNVKSFPFCMPQ